MYYNLKEFGNALRRIRSTQHITQQDINNKVSINLETLRKIENGLVLPKQETLDLLSTALNIDIAKLFLTYRMDNYSILETLKKDLDFHLDDEDYSALQDDLIKLNDLTTYNMNPFFKNRVSQLIFMIQGVLIEVYTKDYTLEISHYVQGLSYTIESFDLNHYQNYYYNELELRLLMNIALSKYNMGLVQECIDILTFCINFFQEYNMTSASNLLSKLHYNMAYTFHRIGDHPKALKHANLGIQHTIANRSIVFLAHLYYRKGIAEFHLNDDQYLDTLKYAKNLFLTSNHKQLCLKVIDSCKTYYGIIL